MMPQVRAQSLPGSEVEGGKDRRVVAWLLPSPRGAQDAAT
ncbi:hypothetical protein GALL_510380 [mine drainage metagenome]|uniref:Uncharacterized protein n=1 Tax=mine drainage metagenome TaxID=410659 RepID=A0A1J5P9F7_9ZZZZ